MTGAGRRPNILWYCSDQQRHDTVRALGHAHIDTPQLDTLCALGLQSRVVAAALPDGSSSQPSYLGKVIHDVPGAGSRSAPDVEAVKAAAATGKIGDGKSFVLNVEDAVRIRTGETGSAAL